MPPSIWLLESCADAVILQGEGELGLAAGIWPACAHHLRQQLPHSTYQGGKQGTLCRV